MSNRPIAYALVAAALLAPPLDLAQATGGDYGVVTGSGRYEACLATVARDPDKGFDEALIWGDQGGGVPARHCAALALFELGHHGEAAKRLGDLAREPGAGAAGLRAQILSQAGHAWLLQGENAHAASEFTAAIDLAGEAPSLRFELYYDRARAYLLDGKWLPAIDDLTTLLTARPRATDAFVLRARAYRGQGSLASARADAEAALALAPENAEAHFERGAALLLQGDRAAARADFIRTLRLSPEGPIADAARAALERIELGAPG